MLLREAFQRDGSVIAAELRPPRTELDAAAGMDAWIDTYHTVRRLTRDEIFVFLTDSAVGQQEEDSLRHLSANLGTQTPRDRVVPFLTAKHTLAHCLGYADRARELGFAALVVLGGDYLTFPEEDLDKLRVLMTVLGGEVVHEVSGAF